MSALHGAGVTVKTGCDLVGLPRSTFYRISRGYQHYTRVAQPMPHRDRRQPAALTPAERHALLDILTREEFQDLSVSQTYWRALDLDLLGCSERTFYRVAAAHQLVGDRRPTRVRTGGGATSRRVPIVHADKPDDLWSWDITELRGPGQDRYRLYLVMDVFSRAAVAWRVEYTEDTHKVIAMFGQAFTDHTIPGCVHSDNGPSMRSHALVDTLHQAGVLTSYARPRVSDDNPFSESLFKTIKYDLTIPDRFDSIDHARAWIDHFLHTYNTQHRHSGIGHYTPASVHQGTAHHTQHRRRQTLHAYYNRHPERFTRRPEAPALPQPTGINTQLSHAA